ncbi:MAG TPA: TIGR02587 family membrane protein [Longimicrobium sp.]|nr:TIGR02587 family membrane protein [Longimicrobium sp.]
MAASAAERRTADRRLLVGLARAFGGAVFFSLPLLMTMEMWWLGFYMDRWRLALFMALMVPLLIVLDHYSGWEETATWSEDVLDGMIAYGVGLAASALILLLFGIIGFGMPLGEVVGKIAIEAVPASLGAVLAGSQLAQRDDDEEGDVEQKRRERARYPEEVFFMAVGAIFLAFNVAPTEEMILISFVMTEWHGIALALTSLAMMHAFVFGLSFRGTHQRQQGITPASLFFRYTMVGYAVALLVSAYVLWTFGRLEAEGVRSSVMMIVVLGFPASLGAAAARLIL